MDFQARKLARPSKIIFVNLLVTFLLCEVVLRLAWYNPYVLPDRHAFIHHPNLHLKFHNLERVYDGAPEPVYFNTSPLGYVENDRVRAWREKGGGGSYSVAVGGSTTESVTVQENARWPDLLEPLTLNYGKSRMDSVNSYHNIRYILEKQGLRPKNFLVMDGINNLSHFLRQGSGALNPEDGRRERGWTGYVSQNSYFAAFVWRFLKQNDYFPFYFKQAEQSRALPSLSDEEFWNYLKDNAPLIREKLTRIYGLMANQASSFGAYLIILTQPHAFYENYRPFRGNDLRTLPAIKGHGTNITQARRLMQFFNDLTIEAAQANRLPVIDAAGCFSKLNVSDLIYDSVHFTAKGSQELARCLNHALPVIGQVANSGRWLK